jgi:NTE family protein
VGALIALFEAGLEPPDLICGASVGALNGAAIAAYPGLGGAQTLRQIWLSQLVRDVFKPRAGRFVLSRLRRTTAALPSTPVRRLIDRVVSMTGVTRFEDLKGRLAVVATDLVGGGPVVFESGPLKPALLASTAIPGIYPAVEIDGRAYLDGGIVDNTPIQVAVERGAKDVLAIGLMAGGEVEAAPVTWRGILERTLQLSLHHRLLSDFQRLKDEGRVVVICPITHGDADHAVRSRQVDEVIERSRAATAGLLAGHGSKLFRRSAIHYLQVA